MSWHNTGKHKFKNPWSDDSDFVNLGRLEVGSLDPDHRQNKDIYALKSHHPSHISFGARYGNKPHEYLSGEASYSSKEKEWTIYGGYEIHVAATRYFANVYKPEGMEILRSSSARALERQVAYTKFLHEKCKGLEALLESLGPVNL